MTHPPQSRIADHLVNARRALDRVLPSELDDFQQRGAIVVDIRPAENRDQEGSLPGAVVIDRNVLEWRLDPTSPDRIDRDLVSTSHIILVCNEGYASSLAAMSLREIGLERATDLIGGYRAWRREQSESATGKTPAPGQ
jgi:rhodanese-related sulfurtransferase